VVAHSYGGIVTAEAAAGVGAVSHLLLVSSYLPEVGQSLSSFGSEEPAPFLDIDPEGGTFTVRPEALARGSSKTAIRIPSDGPWTKRPAEPGRPRTTGAGGSLAATGLDYLVCAEDRGTPADLQPRVRR